MRILDIVAEASRHSELSYGRLSSLLCLSGNEGDATVNDQVESCVIDAISSGLLQGKLDQLAGKFVVTYVAFFVRFLWFPLMEIF